MNKSVINRIGGAAVALAALAIGGGTYATGLDDPLVVEGKLLYDETAGGIGCATCHGMEGTGDPDAGGVYIQGVLASTMYSAMNGGVEEMSEIFNLNAHEIAAIQAYLNYLYENSRSAGGPEAVVFPGKEIFLETAGGVGCASCHNDDATGDIGPNIQGRSAADVRAALNGGVEDMGFIELTTEEIDQVVEYLAFMADASAN